MRISLPRRLLSVAFVALVIGAGIGALSGRGSANGAARARHGTAINGQGGTIAAIVPNGGLSAIGESNGLALAMSYAANDATPGTALALRGSVSVLGAPIPPSGTPVLALRVEVSGTRVVTFGDAAPSAMLRWPLLRAGVDYSIYLFAAGQAVGVPFDAGKPSNGTLRFPSPLSDLSLSPSAPLIVELVAGAHVGSSSVVGTTVPLVRGGATVELPDSGAFTGTVEYAANDAAPGTELTATTSGDQNITNAIVPSPARETLFLQLRTEGDRAVSFLRGARPVGALFTLNGSPNVSVRSPMLPSGVGFDAFLFAGGRLVHLGHSVVSSDGLLTVRSPLSGVTVSPGMPIVIEFVGSGGQAGAAKIPPHARAVPSPGIALDDTGTGFYVLPPGVKPVNNVRPSKIPGARRSYAWWRHGKKRVLVQFTSQIQHVVVIYMENRTPDDLFSGYYSVQYPPAPLGTTFGRALDLANPAGSPTLAPNALAAAFDPAHSHLGFVNQVAGSPNAPKCPAGGCPTGWSLNSYIPVTSGNPPQSEVQNYISLIQEWSYASHVLQSNEGPSFPAHQYAIAGQAGGVINFFGTPIPTPSPTPTLNPFGMVENPRNHSGIGDFDPSDPDPDAVVGGGSCFNQTSKLVNTVNMTSPYPGVEAGSPTPPPCNEYLTIFDEMQATMPTPFYNDWQYIANSKTTIWSGPMAVNHLYQDYLGGTAATQPFAADPDAQQFVKALVSPGPTSRPFASLTFITACVAESDHPRLSGISDGPQWLAYVINAIGTSNSGNNWKNTAIVVTWDDWGGFYDHYTPTPFPYHPASNAYGNTSDPNEWGYRVPLILISPYVKSHGLVSTKLRSQGAILNFIESVFSLNSLGTDDAANGSDNLTDMVNLNQVPPGATFSPLPTPSFSPSADGSCPSS